jgi:hypothetical protein
MREKKNTNTKLFLFSSVLQWRPRIWERSRLWPVVLEQFTFRAHTKTDEAIRTLGGTGGALEGRIHW